MTDWLQRIVFRAALPVVALQGAWVKATAPRFDPAAGPCQGSVGDGELVRLVTIGDSIVAGVGIGRIEDAMPGQLARALAARTGRRVEWSAHGVSGIGVAAVRRTLVPKVPDGAADVVFLSVGVNDVTALRTVRHWCRELAGLVRDMEARAPRGVIVVSGLPPLHGFPLLPQPLRAILGMRARTFDRIAEQLVGEMPGALFVPNRFAPDPAFFAPDGYHPSKESCALWARTVVEAVVSRGGRAGF